MSEQEGRIWDLAVRILQEGEEEALGREAGRHTSQEVIEAAEMARRARGEAPDLLDLLDTGLARAGY